MLLSFRLSNTNLKYLQNNWNYIYSNQKYPHHRRTLIQSHNRPHSLEHKQREMFRFLEYTHKVDSLPYSLLHNLYCQHYFRHRKLLWALLFHLRILLYKCLAQKKIHLNNSNLLKLQYNQIYILDYQFYFHHRIFLIQLC